MTRSKTKLRDEVRDTDDDDNSVPELIGESASEISEHEFNSDEYNIKNGEDKVIINMNPIIPTDDYVIVPFDETRVHVFVDDTMYSWIVNGDKLERWQIMQGPKYPPTSFLEEYSSGDGGASEALDIHEANQIWKRFGNDSRVMKCRLATILRRAGIYLGMHDLNPNECTEKFESFTCNDANHTRFALDPIDITGTPYMAAVYKETLNKMVGLREAQMIRMQGYGLWVAELETMEVDVIRQHQDAFYWYDNRLDDLDANRMHMKYLQIAQNMEWGDATHIEAYIEIGQLVYEYRHKKGIFHHKRWSDAEIRAQHENYFDLPDGYHTDNRYHINYAAYDDIEEDWPGNMERQIHRSEMPPDWVAGPEGDTITCENVTVKVRTRLPIPEGCLNSDM